MVSVDGLVDLEVDLGVDNLREARAGRRGGDVGRNGGGRGCVEGPAYGIEVANDLEALCRVVQRESGPGVVVFWKVCTSVVKGVEDPFCKTAEERETRPGVVVSRNEYTTGFEERADDPLCKAVGRATGPGAAAV